MTLTLILRIAISLTFLILAAGGPYALILLRNFIRRYTVAHDLLKVEYETLKARVTVLERRAGRAESPVPPPEGTST